MEIDTTLTTAALDRMFDDWGFSVIFREVVQFFEPETGELDESYSDTVLTVLCRDRSVKPARDAAGQHTVERATFLVRLSEIPSGANLLTSRIVDGVDEFRIHASEKSTETGLVALKCGRG
jgi:hypothetical protein